MNATKILKSAGLRPSDSMFSVNNEDMMERLLEFIRKWDMSIQFRKISKEDWEILFFSYTDSIIDYHLENNHQERGAFLSNENMLKNTD